VIAMGGLMVLTLGAGLLFGVTLLNNPGIFALGAILAMGLAHLVANAIDERPNGYVIGRTLGLAALVIVGYFALQVGFKHVLSGSLPAGRAPDSQLDLAIVAVVLLAFGCVTVLQNILPYRAHTPRWQAIYTHVANGLYVNTISNRWVLAWWPSKPAAGRT
jgi:NAD(P)H-quinone oxidoreductase subunit 5